MEAMNPGIRFVKKGNYLYVYDKHIMRISYSFITGRYYGAMKYFKYLLPLVKAFEKERLDKIAADKLYCFICNSGNENSKLEHKHRRASKNENRSGNEM